MIRHASLFSGIGGPEVAASMLGWENVFHCEINPFGRAVLDYWFPNSESYEDITKADFTKYRGQIDVLTGGFPCQPFSYAGKREGQADDRYLWPEMLRVIDEVRPTWVIGENVNGITTMVEQCRITEMGIETSLFEEADRVYRYTAESTFTIERICSDLESKGYAVQPMLIPACAVGAPHRRDRIFFIAYNLADTEDLQRNGGSVGHRGSSEREKVSEFGNSDCENVANADSHRRGEVHEHLQPKKPNGAKPVCDGWIGDVADTESQQSNGNRFEESQVSRTKQEQSRRRSCEMFTGLRPGERWSAFPTVSAVHRGNDGLPFDVDNLTIPFTRWRTESLKAYGNAIVPQVMYRIFQIIDSIAKA